jgi:hypothetical protein
MRIAVPLTIDGTTRVKGRMLGVLRSVRTMLETPYTNPGVASVNTGPALGTIRATSGTIAPASDSASDSLSVSAAAWPRCSSIASG